MDEKMTFRSGKAMASSKSHSEAERRRRERINAHLATLRTLLPSAMKTDKATLLGEVVQCVKDLNRRVNDPSLQISGGVMVGGNDCPFPNVEDDVVLNYDPFSSLIEASICCTDRPDLLSSVTNVLLSLGLSLVKAEIETLGGRTRCVLYIQIEGKELLNDLTPLRQGLRRVVLQSSQC